MSRHNCHSHSFEETQGEDGDLELNVSELEFWSDKFPPVGLMMTQLMPLFRIFFDFALLGDGSCNLNAKNNIFYDIKI